MACDTAKERQYAALAGAAAADVYANDEAIRYLERALELADEPKRRPSLMIKLALGRMAQAFARLGQYDEAERRPQHELALGPMLRIPYYLCYALVGGAELYFEQRRYAEARQLNDEALDLAREAKRTQVEFSALVLSIRVRLALYEIDVSTAIHELEALQVEWPAEREQAALDYELWRLQPDLALSRRHAAAVHLYHALYRRTRWIDDRRRYEELGGTALPDPAPLPLLGYHWFIRHEQAGANWMRFVLV